jgi:hypothetical protein
MSNVIYLNVSSRTWSPATAAADAQSRSEEIDHEERRWQMEWDRRNIED